MSCASSIRARRGLAAAAVLWLASGAPAAGDSPAVAEHERARGAAARIEAEWPIIGTGPAVDFVRRLGGELGRTATARGQAWSFLLVRDRSPNAFSIGGGRLYVTEGTFILCRNEAELAAILAHEMGHQLAGHFRRADGRGADDVALGSVRQRVDPGQEREADRISLGILEQAGYDAHAALSIAKRVAGSSALAARHFGDTRRVAALQDLLAGVPRGGRSDSEAFQRLARDLASRS